MVANRTRFTPTYKVKKVTEQGGWHPQYIVVSDSKNGIDPNRVTEEPEKVYFTEMFGEGSPRDLGYRLAREGMQIPANFGEGKGLRSVSHTKISWGAKVAVTSTGLDDAELNELRAAYTSERAALEGRTVDCNV